MEKKKLKINISKLSIGGMERSFLNFLNMSDLPNDYNITVLIGYTTDQKLLKQIPKNINYHVIAKKWNIIGKVHAAFYLALSIIRARVFKNRYDCSIAYSYQHGSLARLTRLESGNNIVFIHTDLLRSRSSKQLRHLVRKTKFDHFSKVICVSNSAAKAFEKIFPNFQGRIFIINNFINYPDIIKKSKEPINFKKQSTTFLNVCRHENDKNKKVSRILKAARRLKDEGYIFEILLIGSGKEDAQYKKYIDANKLSNCVKILGAKSNPFPYFLQSDAVIISSSYEGYGIVIDEARVLKVPIISTDIGDAKQILSQGYGILCDNSSNGVYEGIKTFLKTPQNYNHNFSAKNFNNEINQKLHEAINESSK